MGSMGRRNGQLRRPQLSLEIDTNTTNVSRNSANHIKRKLLMRCSHVRQNIL